MNNFPTFAFAWDAIVADFKQASQLIHTEKWQGIDISKKPEAKTYELLNYDFRVPIITEDIAHWILDIGPNLPWADNHFEERVSGEPLNPGNTWQYWPWGNSAGKFLDENGQFNHNYMERYWPKFAGQKEYIDDMAKEILKDTNKGIRYEYGDLNDIVNLLRNEPYTRQAYMPVFFPEDTGAVHGGRVPCSLGYHFINRNGILHINYYLRSCEVYRHFRDDCYLTVKLLLWVLKQLRSEPGYWDNVKPGFFNMYITSFHCFVNDRDLLK